MDAGQRETCEAVGLFTENIFIFNFHQPHPERGQDKVNLYAKLLLNMGLFYFEFSDVLKEGDGSRVLRCYRYTGKLIPGSRPI